MKLVEELPEAGILGKVKLVLCNSNMMYSSCRITTSVGNEEESLVPLFDAVIETVIGTPDTPSITNRLAGRLNPEIG